MEDEMSRKKFVGTAAAGVAGAAMAGSGVAGAASPVPSGMVTFTTFALFKGTDPEKNDYAGATQEVVADSDSKVYTLAARAPPTYSESEAKIWRLDSKGPVLVGTLEGNGEAPGLAFGPDGYLYIVDPNSGLIVKLMLDEGNPPHIDLNNPGDALVAEGAQQGFGLGFDKQGQLWCGQGTPPLNPSGPGFQLSHPKYHGRIYKVDTDAKKAYVYFRVPTARNKLDVGRQNLRCPAAPGGIGPFTGSEATVLAPHTVFGPDGNMYIDDPVRGCLWKVRFDADGNLMPGQMTTDTTYEIDPEEDPYKGTSPSEDPNPAVHYAESGQYAYQGTISLDCVYVSHPYLLNCTKPAFDVEGNMWAAQCGRNSMCFISNQGKVTEVFRNEVNKDGLRCGFGIPGKDRKILEYPTATLLVGKNVYAASFSFAGSNNTDNYPQENGEIKPGEGKISKMDQEAGIEGFKQPPQ